MGGKREAFLSSCMQDIALIAALELYYANELYTMARPLRTNQYGLHERA